MRTDADCFPEPSYGDAVTVDHQLFQVGVTFGHVREASLLLAALQGGWVVEREDFELQAWTGKT